MDYKKKELVDAFILSPDEKNMNALLAYFQYDSPTDSELLLLTNGLANSGQRIQFDQETDVYDIPSSGGPASLSTLLCPLFLVNDDKTVLKLGVPGRPAGGVDVLAQIHGYNISPDIDEIHSWLKRNKYIHFITNNHLTPTDAKLFNFRKKNNGINIPLLAIASLLSKKIAVGVNHVGLDVRVSSFGNFGRTWEEASENAIRFNKIAKSAGIISKCFLSNGNSPQQPYIGRGESILAIQKILNGTAENSLMIHFNTCYKMAHLLCNKQQSEYSIDSIRSSFHDNILLQGGKIESFEEIAFDINNKHEYYFESWGEGYLKIDVEKVRTVIVTIQEKCPGIFPDPCGLILKASNNDYIKKRDVLFSFRCIVEYKTEFEINLKKAFSFLNEPIFYFKEFEEIA